MDGDFLDAVRGVADGTQGGWKMVPVSTPRGNSYVDAKMRAEDVRSAMKLGTVVFNSAGAYLPLCGAQVSILLEIKKLGS